MRNSKQLKLFYEHPFHELTHGQFTWCLHCQCVHRTEDWVGNDWDCPDKDCNGTALDAHPWFRDNWPRNMHPEYPEFPEVGKCYPLS